MSLSRRQFTQATLGSLLTYSLLETLMTGDVFAADMKLLAGKWMKDLNDLSEAVKGQKLKQTDCRRRWTSCSPRWTWRTPSSSSTSRS